MSPTGTPLLDSVRFPSDLGNFSVRDIVATGLAEFGTDAPRTLGRGVNAH